MRGRPHHGAFTHEALPGALFQYQDRFVDALRESSGPTTLRSLWEYTGDQIASMGAPRLPCPTMSCEPIEGNGWRGVAIRMPDTNEIGECSMALLAVPDGAARQGLWPLYAKRGAPLARLFVLKLLHFPHKERPEFQICEVSPLIGHVTTGYTCEPNAKDLAREVADCLDLE